VPSLDNTHAHEHYRIVLAVRSNVGLAAETEYVADIEMQIACTGPDARHTYIIQQAWRPWPCRGMCLSRFSRKDRYGHKLCIDHAANDRS
jgi:hypothetical protein